MMTLEAETDRTRAALIEAAEAATARLPLVMRILVGADLEDVQFVYAAARAALNLAKGRTA